jgi:hypothetical protein
MAYIYCADIYCDDCGKEICRNIKAEGHAPEDVNDETTFDSDEYPKYCDDDAETDSPQHCGNHADCINFIRLGDGDSQINNIFHQFSLFTKIVRIYCFGKFN